MNEVKNDADAPQAYDRVIFKCGCCSTILTCTYEQVQTLIEDKSIACTECNQPLTAGYPDQQMLNEQLSKQAAEGKRLMIVCGVWFSLSLIVMLLYSTLAGGLMSGLGFLIAKGMDSSPATDDVVVLKACGV